MCVKCLYLLYLLVFQIKDNRQSEVLTLKSSKLVNMEVIDTYISCKLI